MSLIDDVTLVKFIASIAGAIILTLSVSACGVSLGDSFVAGTTGYLAEHNRGAPMDQHSRDDKRELEQTIARRY